MFKCDDNRSAINKARYRDQEGGENEGVRCRQFASKGGGGGGGGGAVFIRDSVTNEEEEEAVITRESITEEDPPNARQVIHRPKPRFDEWDGGGGCLLSGRMLHGL